MGNDGATKNPGQRKRRQERESCINNVKLNVNLTSSKDYCRHNVHQQQRPIDNSTYTRRRYQDKFQRGSLENVSSNPWGEVRLDEQSTLRRSRSLAIARDDVFSNLDISNSRRPKPRKQLIPRAKLIERSVGKDQKCVVKGSSAENLHGIDRPLIKRKSSVTPPEYSPPLENSQRNRPNRRTANTEAGYSSISNLAGPKFIIGAQHDGLDSNYYNKTSLNATYQVSYEDLPGLSLPNYYPDSKYDTDNTDNVSGTDNISSESCDNISKKYSSCDNISTEKWIINESESISYDENIVLSTNRPLYDSIKENHYAKPRTIRGPTPYNRENQTYYYKEKRQSLASSISDSSEDKHNLEGDKISLDYFETDTNFDEIKLNNENITKIVETEDNERDDNNNAIEENNEALKAPVKIYEEIEEPQEKKEDEEFKTIVAVDTERKEESDEEKNKENKHSHNYLREFIESQKGSRKPLQNFLTKKFSNLSRKNSKEIPSNLADNQFHSLPDITASKNLRKCEKIDRKLRKCEKTRCINKIKDSSENRFIVNIGKHFDITANSSVPVDFEVKIAKVPRKNKNTKKVKGKGEDQFLEAVKNLKDTLNNNNNTLEEQNVTKPEIIGIRAKAQNADKAGDCSDKEEQEITMELHDECVKEYKEKLGTMRDYWGKMVFGTTKNDSEEPQTANDSRCKIVEVQTKVEDVKKKFEPCEEKEQEKPNKVQVAKQIFEQKPVEKTGKISPMIKESCNYFEKPNYFIRDNQFESLNPNIVEIINKDDGREKRKERKAVAKSTSITYPEFDHVRYRVVKSDLFQKKIFANCEKESQFDGLMQYLQDYSFQELLIDNNIVIIEPIRTKIPHEASKKIKNTKNITPLLHKNNKTDLTDGNGLKRHFFYHPIRVNKEVNDDELPNPDTVKQARQFFEGGLTRSQSSQEFQDITQLKCSNGKPVDPDKDHCSATDSNSNPSNISDFGSQENLYDSVEHCCEQQYVSEDILEKIRECGTTVTYYGGRVVKKQGSQPILTKAIMEEIRNNEKRSGDCNCRKIKEEIENNNKDIYQGVKFRLVKSNSCSSRLELVGTSDLKEAAKKYLNKQVQQNNLKNVKELREPEDYVAKKQVDKNAINENIKKSLEENQPKIIGEEKKMTQWGDASKDKVLNINYSDNPRQKVNHYHNYDKLGKKSKKIDDMEFEPYEVA